MSQKKTIKDVETKLTKALKDSETRQEKKWMTGKKEL